MATLREWRIVTGPNKWDLSLTFWESECRENDAEFTVEDPETHKRYKLYMSLYIMGRGPSAGVSLFFSGPSVLINPEWATDGSEAALIHIGKAAVSSYDINAGTGKVKFKKWVILGSSLV